MVLAALTVLSACSGRAVQDKEKLLKFLAATEAEPHAFTYTDKTASHLVIVKGEVQDDLRSKATLRIDGSEALDEVILDDALVVRAIDPSKLSQLESSSASAAPDPGTQAALMNGQWVVDYRGAPPLLAQNNRDGSMNVGINYILDSRYIFQYIRRALNEGAAVRLFNPDEVTYIASEDPFEQPPEGGEVLRYDVAAPPLPRRGQRGTSAALPGIAHFRKLSFYVSNGKVVKVLEQIDFESHHDFVRAREGKGPRYPLQLLAAVRAGHARETIRTRFMSYVVSRLGDRDIRIGLPPEMVAGELAGRFGPSGLSAAAPYSGEVNGGQEQSPAAENGSTTTATAGG